MKLDSAMMQKLRTQVVRSIERGQITRFCEAIGAADPVHRDDKVARAHGYRSVVAPPTFLATLEPVDEIASRLSIDPHRLMLVEQKWEYQLPVCAGDEVHIAARVAHAHEKVVSATAKVTFIVVETIGRNVKNQQLFKGLRTYVYTRTKSQAEG